MPKDPEDGLEINSFNAFFRESKDRVLRAVVMSTGNAHDAEDCVAEAFRKAYLNWDELRAMTAPALWVVKVANNLHIDRHRKHTRTLKLLPQLVRVEHIDQPNLPIDPKLAQAIRELPARQRQILAYRVLLELTAKETARELSITVPTVNTHLHRALKSLRSSLEANRWSER